MDARRLSRRPARDDEGFTLVEVLVSMLVLTAALLALGLVQTRAMNSVALSEERQQATGYASSLLELARAYTADADGFDDALEHATAHANEPFQLAPTTVRAVVGGTISDTPFTTKIYVARAWLPGRDPATDPPAADLVEIRAETTWTSRNSGGTARTVTVRSQLSRPLS